MTVEEASEYLHLHPQTIYVMARQGALPILKVGRAVRFDKLALDRWIQRKMDENHEKLLPFTDDDERC